MPASAPLSPAAEGRTCCAWEALPAPQEPSPSSHREPTSPAGRWPCRHAEPGLLQPTGTAVQGAAHRPPGARGLLQGLCLPWPFLDSPMGDGSDIAAVPASAVVNAPSAVSWAMDCEAAPGGHHASRAGGPPHAMDPSAQLGSDMSLEH